MPRLPKAEVEQSQIYGTAKIDSNLTMRERMKKLFRPSDTVKVRNVTNQKLKWQWLDEEDEDYTIEDETNIKIVQREDPGVWELDGGQTDILPGSCAYIMIEQQFKMVCIMKTGIVITPHAENEIRNFSFDDPEAQERFISMVFAGKLSTSQMQRAALADLTSGDNAPAVLENLAPLPTPQEEFQRRNQANSSIQTRPGVAQAPVETTIPQHTELSDLEKEFNDADAGSTLFGAATGGLPEDRKAPDPEPEKPKAEKPAAKPKPSAKDKEPVA